MVEGQEPGLDNDVGICASQEEGELGPREVSRDSSHGHHAGGQGRHSTAEADPADILSKHVRANADRGVPIQERKRGQSQVEALEPKVVFPGGKVVVFKIWESCYLF